MNVFDRLKLFGLVLLAGLFLVVVWTLGSPLLVGWPLTIYVLWRAWPAVSADLRRVHRRFFPAREWRI